VDGLIKHIQTLYQRVEKNKGAYIQLSRALDALASREPTWAKIAEVLIPVCVSVGLLVAGNVNVPEPTEFLKLAHSIVEDINRVVEPMEAAEKLGDDLIELIKSHPTKK
jgi:hypothetical protein